MCQLPPEASHPPSFAARLQKPAYGMNDAPLRWWDILDKALSTDGMVPTRADRCDAVTSFIRYSHVSELGNTGDKRAIARQNGTKEASSLNHVSSQNWKSSCRKIRCKNHQTKCRDNLFGTCENEMEQRVLTGRGIRVPSWFRKLDDGIGFHRT